MLAVTESSILPLNQSAPLIYEQFQSMQMNKETERRTHFTARLRKKEVASVRNIHCLSFYARYWRLDKTLAQHS